MLVAHRGLHGAFPLFHLLVTWSWLRCKGSPRVSALGCQSFPTILLQHGCKGSTRASVHGEMTFRKCLDFLILRLFVSFP